MIIFPTDHLNPDTGQMDNKDDDELLLTTREKNGKNDDILSLHSNNCLVNANNCSAMIAELGEGWGHGEEARAVT